MALTLKVETTCRETVSSCIIFQNRLWVLGEREGPVDIHEQEWLGGALVCLVPWEVPWLVLCEGSALGCPG